MTRSRAPRSQGGFSLIELMLVVTIVGILSSIASVAWQRYVKRARTSEAAGHLQKMWVGAMSYYETDHASSTGAMVDRQFPFDPAIQWEPICCPTACAGSSPVYATTVWRALNFNISDRHLYRPIYYGGFPIPKKNLWMEARGDLDCDNTESIFTRKATVTSNGDVQGYATPAIVNETE
jgi:prepilin-type N-terminal cleavage/methylation domain-containing protein